MQKMVLVPEKVFKNMKEGTMQEGGKKEADDMRMAKFQDAYIRNKNEQEIKEDYEWNKIGKRLKPMFKESNDIGFASEMIKKYPTSMQPKVEYILKMLMNLPKVKLEKDRILVDGSPMSGTLEEVVADIMINEVSSTKNVIDQLRHSNEKGQDEDTPFESIADTMESYINSQQPTTPFHTPRASFSTPSQTPGATYSTPSQTPGDRSFQTPGASPFPTTRSSPYRSRSPYGTRARKSRAKTLSPHKTLRKALDSETDRLKKNGQEGKGTSKSKIRWEPY